MVCEFCSTARDEIEKLNARLKEDDKLMQSGLKSLNELQGEIVKQRWEIRELKEEVTVLKEDLNDSVSNRELDAIVEERIADSGYVR